VRGALTEMASDSRTISGQFVISESALSLIPPVSSDNNQLNWCSDQMQLITKLDISITFARINLVPHPSRHTVPKCSQKSLACALQ
jgi:hypothetical protein